MIPGAQSWSPSLIAQMGDDTLAVVPLEIKTRVSENILSNLFVNHDAGLQCVRVLDDEVRRQVQDGHLMQMIH